MNSFWNGKRVFLTGHTGFKGTWLAALLKRLGAEVFGYSLPPHTNPSLWQMMASEKLCVGENLADIRDMSRLRACIQEFKPHIAFHLAAQPLVRMSYEEPIETFAVNVLGTACFLEALRGVRDLQAAVVITTDKVYQNNEGPWPFRENDPLGGKDPYSASKACAELVAASYRASFYDEASQASAALVTARAGNVIGGGDWSKDRIIPDIVNAWQRQEPLVLRKPDAVRPWQHVLDPLIGYLTLAERAASRSLPGALHEWNFGPNLSDCVSVRTLCGQAQKHLAGLSIVYGDEGRFKESGFLTLDCSRARTALEWKPLFDLHEALSMTFEVYRAAGEAKGCASLVLSQVDVALRKAHFI